MNDRVDIAIAVDLDGVHLGEKSLPVSVARALLPPERWVGASCHGAACAATAKREGADFVFLGTIFATPSHAGVGGIGPEGLARALEGLGDLPAFGIGGIDVARVPSVLEAGAYGVAVVRGVWDTRDPGEAVRRYLEAIETKGEGRLGDDADDAHPIEWKGA